MTIQHTLPRTFRDMPLAVLAAIQHYINTNGDDPCTREQAAAHEAGHCVVGSALGDTMVEARIWRDSSQHWLGSSRRESGLPADFQYYPLERPEDARLAILNLLAGFVGEIVAGHDHPSSSLDERILAEAAVMQIAPRFGLTAQQMFMQSKIFVVDTLLDNILAFDLVRLHLAQRQRLSRGEANRMLASVACKEIGHG
jgi:hypothetical protein